MKDIRAQVIAFASILQSLQAVDELANKGSCNTFTLETCLDSLLATKINTIDEIYPNILGLKPGLVLLSHQLGESFNKHDIQLTKYLSGVLHLANKLAKFPNYTQVIQEGVEKAIALKDDYPVTHENMQARLAGIYSDSIGLIPPKILIQGEQGVLNNIATVNKIRALLLSAIRNTLLWKQFGGSKWTLLFSRKKYYVEVKALLEQI